MKFDEACQTLQSIFVGDARRRIVDHALAAKGFDRALTRLRDGLETHRLDAPGGAVRLDGLVESLDARNRKDGFHVLHDWDGKASRFNDDTIPVEVANFLFDKELGGDPAATLAVLLDYYLLYVLALTSLRAWDDGDAGDALDRVTELLGVLQGPDGSGQRFVDDALTLISVATAHFEPDDAAYDRLFDKVRALGPDHRLNQAFVSSSLLSCHLRFGFEATYGRDILEMRADNVPDYPWLCFALTTLMEAYESLGPEDPEAEERERIIEALVNGLSPDPRAFVGAVTAALAPHEDVLSAFKDAFVRHKESLLHEFERFRPTENRYSPMSFAFNFSHNTLKALVVDALLNGRPWTLALNDLFSGLPDDDGASAAKRELATVLADYGRQSPDRFRGRLVPVILYDPRLGRRFYRSTVDRLAK